MSAAAETIAVSVNGRDHRVAAGTRLPELLESLGLDAKRVAVERNREVVPRARHAETVVEEGDSLEVVQFVGGG